MLVSVPLDMAAPPAITPYLAAPALLASTRQDPTTLHVVIAPQAHTPLTRVLTPAPQNALIAESALFPPRAAPILAPPLPARPARLVRT